MGFKTGYIGKVGHDTTGEKLRAEMERVDLRGVVSGGMSGRCLCILDAKQDRFILLESNANDTLSAKEIDFAYASQTHYIHFTSFVAEKPLLAQRALLDRVASPTRISFDPGEVYARRGVRYLKPLLEKSFVVFLTETETEMLTGLNPADGRRRLMEVGPSVLVCKRGERGVQVLSHDQEFDIPAEQTEVTDNTGAGDVFNAGFLAGLRLNRPLLDCARFGTRIAARSVGGYGRSQYPTKEDLDFFKNRGDNA
jgi:ribokinase